MNGVFKSGSGAHLYRFFKSTDLTGKGQKKMIAAWSHKMGQDFCKGMALTIAIYGLLTAMSVLTALF